jgi:SH3 domain-containing YSC84-like protein 1
MPGGSGFGDKPARPTAPKPVFTRKDSLGRDQYIAQFTFDGEQSGDLSFKKGDIIEVTKSSGSRNVSLTSSVKC